MPRQKPNLIFVLLFLATFSAPLIFAQENWPQWGGANGDFKIANSQIMKKWTSEGPSELWSRELGSGNSGIVIDDDWLFTMYRPLNDAGDAQFNEYVVAIDASNGKTQWEYYYPAPPIEGQEQYGGGIGPHATPLITEKYLYTVGYTGMLHCFDRTNGSVVWSYNLVKDFDATPVQFGFSASPIIYQNKVIVQACGPESGLIAFDKSTGKVHWKSPPAKFSYATPVIIQYEKEDFLVLVGGDAVEGIDSENGQIRWTYPMREKGLTNVPTPVWLENQFLLIAGQGVNGGELLRFSGPTADIKIESIWHNNKVSLFVNNLVVNGDYAYGGDDFFFGFNWRTGKLLWKKRGFKNANVLLHGDLGIFLTQDGEMVLAELTPEDLKEISRFNLFDGSAWTIPTVVNGKLYSRNRELLVALDLTGKHNAEGKPLSLRQIELKFQKLARSGQIPAVIESFHQYRSMPSTDIDHRILAKIGQALLEKKQYENALLLLAANAKAFPNNTATQINLANALLQSGQQKAAADVYQSILTIEPNHPVASSLLPQLQPDVISGSGTMFQLKDYSDARLVTVAGSFNGWHPQQTIMQRTDEGWRCEIQLDAGEYTYKFVVDGQWIIDPGNPDKIDDGNGNINSRLVVSSQ